MFDKLAKLIALALLAILVYSHAQQVEVGRFQAWTNNPVLVDTRTGRVYIWSAGGGARLVAVVKVAGKVPAAQLTGDTSASPPLR